MRIRPLVALIVILNAACMRARSPWAVSPIGHGGAPNSAGPGPRPIGWRADGLAAPAPQDCQPRGLRHDLRCAVCPVDDAFAAALPHRPTPGRNAP